MKPVILTLLFIYLCPTARAKVFSTPDVFYRKGIERFLEAVNPPQIEDASSLTNSLGASGAVPDEGQLLADLPQIHEVATSETSQVNALQFEDFRKPVGLLPVLQPAEFALYSNPNPAFMLGNPGFIDQYPALNMINPRVTMSLLSPYLTYMNRQWVDPVKMNPFMLNPYFAPQNQPVQGKGPNAVVNSGNAFSFPNVYANIPQQFPDPSQQDEQRLIRKV
jgi:hypothetical protein